MFRSPVNRLIHRFQGLGFRLWLLGRTFSLFVSTIRSCWNLRFDISFQRPVTSLWLNAFSRSSPFSIRRLHWVSRSGMLLTEWLCDRRGWSCLLPYRLSRGAVGSCLDFRDIPRDGVKFAAPFKFQQPRTLGPPQYSCWQICHYRMSHTILFHQNSHSWDGPNRIISKPCPMLMLVPLGSATTQTKSSWHAA